MLKEIKRWLMAGQLIWRQGAKSVDKDALLSVLEREHDEWGDTLRNADGVRVLIATSMANYNHASVVERSLAVALTLRGARVEMLLCDRALPACQMTKINSCTPEDLMSRVDTPRCDGCLGDGNRLFHPLGVPIKRFSEYLSENILDKILTISEEIEKEKIPYFCPEGIAIGEHAWAGALRYFGRGDLLGEPNGEGILRRYLRSAMITAEVLSNLLEAEEYDVAVFHHGIYTPQGIIGEICRKKNIRVVNWNPSYRKNTFIFSHDDTYHHTMVSEPVNFWKNIVWTAELERVTMEYLKSRRAGSSDWIWFHEHPEENVSLFESEFGINWEKPCIGLLTSVLWDAQLHYKANAFPNMIEWLVYTIEYFRQRQDLQLLIRIHPAEVRGMVPSRQKVADVLKYRIEKIPENVFLIPPEHQASTYALMERCDSVLIFNTKTGIELAALGVPIVVAGEAWIRGKGFCWDVESPEAYGKILDEIPFGFRLADDKLMDAKRYAFHFFFRRMLELPFIGSPHKYEFSVDVTSLCDLKAKQWSGLDIICDGILHGSPFVDEYEHRFLKW